MKAYRAKGHALERIFGNIDKQYKKLFYYKNELLRTHPCSTVQIHYENHRCTPTSSLRFLRIYICLGPLKIGWKRFCRPIIFLDACFLRGSYKGHILIAIGIDQNNSWWPIAWSVGETESYEQWKWFLDHLDEDLQLSENWPRYVFMSDQQKGLSKIIAEKYPVSTGSVYNICTTTLRSGSRLNNMCETFNAKIIEPCKKPILTLLEEIRTNQLERIQIRGQWVKNYNYPVPPVIKELLDKAASNSTSWRAFWNVENEYQTSGPAGQFVVNMLNRTCTCRLWQISGIPFVHVTTSILKYKHPLIDYVSAFYSRSSMAALYEHVLYPINGMENWSRSSDVGFELDPPNTKRQCGRPRKLRRERPQRTAMLSCGRCGQIGHNRRSCQNDPSAPNNQRSQASAQPSSHGSQEPDTQRDRPPCPTTETTTGSSRAASLSTRVRKAQRCGRRKMND
ncbi:uncharacterized protein LOC121757892 [Salvia splendens]|uniref:uncharacterized protein LOC121757892 n=1 Tax=Salvia splendens TaxID=180675 RepID=UPI001C255B4C|nr:uncharacterized protein LOC121757892 [Salvia splendens]